MTVNCMAHILNFSAKALLLGMTLVNEDERTRETDIEDKGSGKNDDDVGLEENKVAQTVLKVHSTSFPIPVVADTDRLQVRRVAVLVNSSPQQQESFLNLQTSRPHVLPVCDIRTWWNSTFLILIRTLCLQCIIEV
jgi:hypothetical protein